MRSALVEHQHRIIELCRSFGVKRLEVFGSAATNDFSSKSDYDFLVFYPDDYDYGPWLARLFELEDTLDELLGRDVDLVMPKALENPWFKAEADKTRRTIYEDSNASA